MGALLYSWSKLWLDKDPVCADHSHLFKSLMIKTRFLHVLFFFLKMIPITICYYVINVFLKYMRKKLSYPHLMKNMQNWFINPCLKKKKKQYDHAWPEIPIYFLIYTKNGSWYPEGGYNRHSFTHLWHETHVLPLLLIEQPWLKLSLLLENGWELHVPQLPQIMTFPEFTLTSWTLTWS